MLARKHSVILVSNRQTKCCACTFRQIKKKKKDQQEMDENYNNNYSIK